MNVPKAVFAFFLAAITAFAATDSIAQFRGGIPGDGMRGGGRGGPADNDRNPRSGRDQRPAMQENSEAQVEYRLDLLREDLKLSSDQQSAWQSYADKVKALASDISRGRGRRQLAMQPNTLQQIDQAVDVARNRLTALEDIASAAKALYAALSPQQRSVADPRLATIIPAAGGLVAGPEGPGRRPNVQ